MATPRIAEPRAPGFWPLAIVFALFVLFMYGPMFVIFVLSFQGPEGGLTFPLRGVSLHWFHKLAEGLGTEMMEVCLPLTQSGHIIGFGFVFNVFNCLGNSACGFAVTFVFTDRH